MGRTNEPDMLSPEADPFSRTWKVEAAVWIGLLDCDPVVQCPALTVDVWSHFGTLADNKKARTLHGRQTRWDRHFQKTYVSPASN